MSKLLVCLLVLGFAMHAEAKPVHAVNRAAMNCTEQWLVRQGYPAGHLFEYLNHPMTNLGGPSLMFYRRFMAKCLTANHFQVGDVSKIGNIQRGVPLEDIMLQIIAITN